MNTNYTSTESASRSTLPYDTYMITLPRRAPAEILQLEEKERSERKRRL